MKKLARDVGVAEPKDNCCDCGVWDEGGVYCYPQSLIYNMLDVMYSKYNLQRLTNPVTDRRKELKKPVPLLTDVTGRCSCCCCCHDLASASAPRVCTI